jgi:hypothetical protein
VLPHECPTRISPVKNLRSCNRSKETRWCVDERCCADIYRVQQQWDLSEVGILFGQVSGAIGRRDNDDGYALTLTPSTGEPELYTAIFENQDSQPEGGFH